jgi:hypothetical protein
MTCSVPVAEDRLDEVAQLLAEAILRSRLRRNRKGDTRRKQSENRLALSATPSAHGSSPDGERA